MAFDLRLVEARLALNLISSLEMPKLAWDALEAGFDGPAIRRLAALDFPTFFQVREVLPLAMKEMGIQKLGETEAALRLAKSIAQGILDSNSDPFRHLRDLEQLWIQTHHCHELRDYGNLDDEVSIARSMGQSDVEIRAWLVERLRVLAGD